MLNNFPKFLKQFFDKIYDSGKEFFLTSSVSNFYDSIKNKLIRRKNCNINDTEMKLRIHLNKRGTKNNAPLLTTHVN